MTAQTFLIFIYTFIFYSCSDQVDTLDKMDKPRLEKTVNCIREIPLPPGYSYVVGGDHFYANWLLDLKIKKDKTVFLYNGQRKQNQNAQYAVLDVNIGNKNLLQCADAAIKLKSDFLYNQKKYCEINYITTSGDSISFLAWRNGKRWKEKAGRLVTAKIISTGNKPETDYKAFMEFVFSYCGTYSLSRQLVSVKTIDSVLPGDIFIQGGFPGHAITVMAVIENKQGERMVLLSQGFMPSQDIHLLKNNNDKLLDPWYKIEKNKPLKTPEWVFEANDLKRWK